MGNAWCEAGTSALWFLEHVRVDLVFKLPAAVGFRSKLLISAWEFRMQESLWDLRGFGERLAQACEVMCSWGAIARRATPAT